MGKTKTKNSFGLQSWGSTIGGKRREPRGGKEEEKGGGEEEIQRSRYVCLRIKSILDS